MSRPSRAALGVDVGTTNTKVVLAAFGDDGSVHEERIRTLPTPADGSRIRDAVLEALRSVTAGVADRVVAIGLASMAETGSVVGPDGEPRGSLLRWNRAESATARALVASAGAAGLYEATGVPVAAKSPLVHWAELAAAGDQRLAGASWTGVADLLAATLTGTASTDRTLAARTMGYRLGSTSPAFDTELLALAGLTPAQFPRVTGPDETAGALTHSAAAALGLPAGLPVVIAGHDHAVGAWAAGVREPGAAADSLGTAEALYRVADDVPREAARGQGMSIGPTVDGRHESLLAANPTAGAFVEWAFAELLPGADRRETLARAEALLTSEGCLPSDAPFVLPYLRGRQAPDPDASTRVRAVPALPPEPGEAILAVLTGLTLHLAWLDSAQSELAGPRNDELVLLGGPGAVNAAWLRLKQRLLPGTLTRVTAAEPVATGAAMIAVQRVTGTTTRLPLSRPGDSGPTSAALEVRPALLDAFVRVATHHEREPG